MFLFVAPSGSAGTGHREWSNARRRMLSRSICDQGASHDQPGACSASIHGFVGPERPLYRTVFRVKPGTPVGSDYDVCVCACT